MKRKILKASIFLMIIAFIMGACERDFDDINTNPNAVIDVPAAYLLPGTIEEIADRMNSSYEMLQCTDNWVQHVAIYNDWNPMQRFEVDKFRMYMFTSMYTGALLDINVLIKKALEENEPGLYGIGLTLHALGFSLVTDAFGDIPYTEALKLTGSESINKPIYDSQELIYRALIDTLTRANSILKSVDNVNLDDGYDPIYDGNVLMWRKFANSLKVRMLMRASAKMDISSDLSAIINDPDEFPLFENNDESAFYTYSGNGVGNDYPLASIFENNLATGGVRISKTLVDYMLSTNDPRLPFYAETNYEGQYVGLSHFIATTGDEVANAFSNLKTELGARDRTIELYEYSELMFLLAEASLKGFIVADAYQYYNNAINGSCQKFGVPLAGITTFLAGSGAFNNSLDQIYWQKWVALYMQGYEAWAEQRRTQVPDLQIPLNALYDVIPYRFFYPESEDVLNKENKDGAAAKLSNGDELDSKLWWMN